MISGAIPRAERAWAGLSFMQKKAGLQYARTSSRRVTAAGHRPTGVGWPPTAVGKAPTAVG